MFGHHEFLGRTSQNDPWPVVSKDRHFDVRLWLMVLVKMAVLLVRLMVLVLVMMMMIMMIVVVVHH